MGGDQEKFFALKAAIKGQIDEKVKEFTAKKNTIDIEIKKLEAELGSDIDTTNVDIYCHYFNGSVPSKKCILASQRSNIHNAIFELGLWVESRTKFEKLCEQKDKDFIANIYKMIYELFDQQSSPTICYFQESKLGNILVKILDTMLIDHQLIDWKEYKQNMMSKLGLSE